MIFSVSTLVFLLPFVHSLPGAGPLDARAGGGRVTVQGGSYTGTLQNTIPIPTTLSKTTELSKICTSPDTTNATSFTREAAQALIHAFCYTNVTGGIFAYNWPMQLNWVDKINNYGPDRQYVFSGKISLAPEVEGDGCPTISLENNILTSENCEAFYMVAVDECNVGTTTEKWGSTQNYIRTDNNGCLQVDFFAYIPEPNVYDTVEVPSIIAANAGPAPTEVIYKTVVAGGTTYEWSTSLGSPSTSAASISTSSSMNSTSTGNSSSCAAASSTTRLANATTTSLSGTGTNPGIILTFFGSAPTGSVSAGTSIPYPNITSSVSRKGKWGPL